MAVKLKKGQGVSLRKDENDLSQVTIGLGWDIAEEKSGGFLGGLFGKKKEEEYDLDVVAFLCAADGKIKNLGDIKDGHPSLLNGDVVFFNSLRHPSGQIWLTGDNRTGAGDGDDEQIIAKLSTVPEQCSKIAFIVQIYQGIERQHNFGKVKNAFIRAVDGKNKEMARFDLSGDATYAPFHSMIFAELEREASGWKFNAIGKPFETDTFVHILRDHYL
jgi:stress response protein SCP2